MDENFEINKTLLIIKSHPHSCTPVEQFLRNRGWQISSAVSLKDAIGVIVSKQPAFVMISVDHPNRKVHTLAKVLTQAFPCCFIAFAENSTSPSFAALSASNSKYLIYPPVTGPSVERTVNKYYKDLASGTASFSDKTVPADNLDSNGLINIRGEGTTLSPEALLAKLMANENTATEGAARAGSWQPVDLEPAPVKLDPAYLAEHDPTLVLTKNHEESIISKATKSALEQSIAKTKKLGALGDLEIIEGTSDVACIPIKTPRHAGYLVAAQGHNQNVDEPLLQSLQSRIYKFLNEHGNDVTWQKTLRLHLQPMPFIFWSLEKASFLRKVAHNNCEVALAFFPRADVLPPLLENTKGDMAAVPMSELKTEVPLEFNLFLHLPANRKYILYTPIGGRFYTNQKEKLLSEGIKTMFIRKSEKQGFYTFRAQNYLNEQIEELPQTEKAQLSPRQDLKSS